MKAMKITATHRAAIALFGLAALSSLSGTAQAQLVDLPDANCGVGSTDFNCLVFDDFTVYSLGLLSHYQKNFGLYEGYDFTYKPNEAEVMIIDGAGKGIKDNQGGTTSIDDPFRGMNSTKTDNMLFLMAGTSITTGNGTIASDPDGTGTWDNYGTAAWTNTYLGVENSTTFTMQEVFGPKHDKQFDGGKDSPCFKDMNTAGCIQSWDAEVAAILEVLNGGSMVVMFNNNETGDSGDLDGQDLAAWATVTLHNGDPTAGVTYTLSGDPTGTILPQQRLAQTTDVDDTLTKFDPTAAAACDDTSPGYAACLAAASDYWAYVHSEICVSASTGAVYLGECSAAALDPVFGFLDGVTVNQSLGADEAGFAVYSAELDEMMHSGQYAYISFDVRFSHLNNGSDNLWIMAADFGNKVPAPATLGLFGIGLLSLAGLRRRNRPGARR